MTAKSVMKRPMQRQRHLVRERKKMAQAANVTLENLDDYLANGQIQPIHPGLLYKNLVIDRTEVTVSSTAKASGVSREMLHRVLRGRASVTPKTAIGLAEASGTEAEFWLRAQVVFDLWKERRKRQGVAASRRLPAKN